MQSITLRNVLCICVVALSITGLAAASASAEPTWMMNKSNIAIGALPTFWHRAKNVLSLHTKIGGNSVLVECFNLEALEGHFLTPKWFLWTLKGFECRVKINGTENAACKPNPGAEPGVVLSNRLLGELTKHSTGEGVVLIKSTVEEVVAGVKQPVFGRIKSSVECPIGSNIPIIGPQFGARDVGGNKSLEEEKVTHVGAQGPLTEIWALSKTEEHKASTTGEVEMELASKEIWNGLL